MFEAPRWNVNRGLHQMKRCEACLWWAIQDNKKIPGKKIEVLPIAMETESN